MKFSREQFDKLGRFYLDDFPYKFSKDELFELFNSLSDYLQSQVVEWGFSDTPTREAIFVEVLSRLGFTPEQYYESELAQKYFKQGIGLTKEQAQAIITHEVKKC